MPLYLELEKTLRTLGEQSSEIDVERRERLAALARYLRERGRKSQPARWTFVCTHNSRRSQMAQILAWALAAHHGVPGVLTFSGGIEVTAVAPPALAALAALGLRFDVERAGANPVYRFRYRSDGPVLRVFSKLIDHPGNPSADFCAILTCSEADAKCPVVPGASHRISLPYDDPKAFDGTDQEASKYEERCREIGRELAFVFTRR